MSRPADPDRYSAVQDGPETELKLKGSRFLGQAFRVSVDRQITERLHAVRAVHHAATHHCWAVRLGAPESVTERFDDDGEPAGTAGRPILNQLRARALHDTLLVVTRYFGGTKLGPGGLARAYGEAAAQAIGATPRRNVLIETRLRVSCSFDDLGAVEATLAREGSVVGDVTREYSPEPRLTVCVRRSRAAQLAASIIEATAGRASVTSGP